MKETPLVSCIMPTCNRRQFVPLAVEYFERQEYEQRELIVVDDGDDPVGDLLPASPAIRYIRLEKKLSVGAKRNLACEEARGELIMHWDDDDWYAERRLRVQVEALLAAGTEICGLRQMLFFDSSSNQVWLYEYPASSRPWLAGGSLLYLKDLWRRSPFADLRVGEDTRFIWAPTRGKLLALPDFTLYLATIHPTNTSPRHTKGPYWKPWSGDLRAVLGADWARYQNQALPVDPAPLQGETCQSGHKESEEPMNSTTGRVPTYSIIMVTHNALEVVRISTLRTLRQSAGQDARLVVVDNASTDGTQQWLELLRQRGDIEYIQNGGNIGHAPAIQLALKQVQSPYLVTLDSDAFPLCADWLNQLRARLVDPVKVTGIRHYRGYIHPSCLMIARQTLQDFGLDFLPRTIGQRRYDVAETISETLKKRSYQLSGLDRSGAIQRGSISEPVYLGSSYEGIVYHQWYTTRQATSGGRPVDDVPSTALETALSSLMNENEQEAREINVIMGIRAGPDTPKRIRNSLATLRALNLQDLERWRYRIIVVEQDSVPRMQSQVQPYADQYIFAYNPGPYNRSWGFNIGATLPGAQQGLLCMADSDLLVPPDFLSSLLKAVRNGARAVRPYDEVQYLDTPSTERALKEYNQQPLAPLNPARYSGHLFQTSMGGCTVVEAGLYRQLGGHDERFSGWGSEDHEFFLRLSRQTQVVSLNRRLLHLEHELPQMVGPVVEANHRLFVRLLAGQEAPFTQPMGSLSRFKPQDAPPPANQPQTARDWQHWHTWQPERIRRIVNDEKQLPPKVSTRGQLARLVSWLGGSLLDVGCASGALWMHLERYRSKLSWMGVDITLQMLQVGREFFPNTPSSMADAVNLPFKTGSFDTVLLHHLLDHLPPWMMEQALSEALRVARLAVVLDFYAAPLEEGDRQTKRINQSFLETHWPVQEITAPVKKANWQVSDRFTLSGRPGETDTVWILRPDQYLEKVVGRLKVSIIMPTYRRGHVIHHTVQQILRQTHTNWELILVDNAGDGEYQFDDPRIRVYRHAERISAAFARNQGLKYVTGDLVCFFDDDDDMFPDYLESFCTAFETFPRLKMARCGMILPDGTFNYSFATPECALRAEFATPTWRPYSSVQDQSYFASIVSANQWRTETGDIVLLNQATCRANTSPKGGARSGRY